MYIINMFLSQSYSGVIICLSIVLISIIHILLNLTTWNFYTKLMIELNKGINNPDYKFKNKVLLKTSEDFKDSMNKGIENINTQVIISKNIPKKININEEFLHYFISLVIVLGLLGTFIGLTGSIFNIKDVLTSIKGKSSDMDNFLNKMALPLSSMSTAFFTSIFGISSSIILSIFGIVLYKNKKNVYYDSIENYLDNVIAANNPRSTFALLTNFTANFEKSMNTLIDRFTTSIDNGVVKLGDRINFAGVDLTETAHTLSCAIDKLDMSINTFSRPIYLFKDSVENFKGYYSGFEKQILEIDKIVSRLSDSMQGTTIALDSNMENMGELGKRLIQSSSNMTRVYEKLLHLMDKTEQSISENSNRTEKNYKELVDKLSKNVNNDLSKPLDQIKWISESMEKQLNLLGKTINSYGKLIDEAGRKLR